MRFSKTAPPPLTFVLSFATTLSPTAKNNIENMVRRFSRPLPLATRPVPKFLPVKFTVEWHVETVVVSVSDVAEWITLRFTVMKLTSAVSVLCRQGFVRMSSTSNGRSTRVSHPQHLNWRSHSFLFPFVTKIQLAFRKVHYSLFI